MAYVPVPKDLTKVKNKVFLNLTLRQIICFAGAAIIGFPFYFLTKGLIGTDMAMMIMIVLMLPFFFIALYEKDGIPAEKIILNFIRAKYLNPKVRLYKTENMYQYLENEGNKTQQRRAKAVEANRPKKKKRKKKK